MNLDHTLLSTETADDGSSVVTHAANIGEGVIVRSIITTQDGGIAACSSFVPGLTVRPGAAGQPGYLKSAVR